MISIARNHDRGCRRRGRFGVNCAGHAQTYSLDVAVRGRLSRGPGHYLALTCSGSADAGSLAFRAPPYASRFSRAGFVNCLGVSARIRRTLELEKAAAKERMSEGGKGKENFLTSPGQARDKIGAEQKKGGRSRPLNFSSRFVLEVSAFEPTIGPRGPLSCRSFYVCCWQTRTFQSGHFGSE
jgi:hypothetical protein